MLNEGSIYAYEKCGFFAIFLVKSVGVFVGYDEQSGDIVEDRVGGDMTRVRFLHSDSERNWPTNVDHYLHDGSSFLDVKNLTEWRPE